VSTTTAALPLPVQPALPTTETAVGRRAWLPVAASVVAIAWGGNEFTPLLIMYRQVSDFSAVVVDGLLGAYVLGIVPALMLGGPLSDLYGRRRLLLPAAPLSFLGSLLLCLGAGFPAVIGLGRVLCGLALGLVMAVGTTWIKELSDRTGADPAAGPRRASLALTGGFLVGAGVASVLAQWAPWPTHTTYVLHMLLTVLAGIWLLRAPETRTPGGHEPLHAQDLVRLLRVPNVAHKRFLRVVVPVAPWVFGCAGAAYAVLPSLLAAHAGSVPVAFSGLMTALTLGCGAGVQLLGKGIDTHRSARASLVAMAIITVGVVLGALAAATTSLVAGFASAAVMGTGYGLALVAGLSEVQRIAVPEDLAGLTAVYYSLAYLGFFIPMLFAALSTTVGYTVLFAIGAGLAALCLVVVATAWKAHLPGARA
jgi:MFS family permease